MSANLILLDILYGVLILAIGGTGLFLMAVLWQLSVTIAAARPHIAKLLEDAGRITADVDSTLEKVDETVQIANSAVAVVGQTTRLVSRTITRPVLTTVACVASGFTTGARYYWDNRHKRTERQQLADGAGIEALR